MVKYYKQLLNLYKISNDVWNEIGFKYGYRFYFIHRVNSFIREFESKSGLKPTFHLFENKSIDVAFEADDRKLIVNLCDDPFYVSFYGYCYDKSNECMGTNISNALEWLKS